MAKNGKLWHSYFNKIKEHICNYKEQKVCCCGTEQKPPDEIQLSNDTIANGTIPLKING